MDTWDERWARDARVYAAVDDPLVNAVLDVLAPRNEISGRSVIFEWGHETTPTAEEMIALAQKIVAALSAQPAG